MIKNEQQYNVTKSYLDKFQHAVLALNQKENTPLLELEKKSIQSQITDLQREIDEYNDLKFGLIPVFELQFIDELSKTLIKARISLGLSQKKLGELVGLKEQQIQRYESTDYESASVARIKEIGSVLNLEIEKNSHSHIENFSKKQFFEKIKEMRLNHEFVVTRILPPSLSTCFVDSDISPQLLVHQAASHVSRIFDITPAKFFSSDPLVLNTNSLTLVNSKSTKNSNNTMLNAYAIYARYIAFLVSRATSHIIPKKISNDPHTIHDEILAKYNVINFNTLLDYIWNIGIPVLTLDSIPFHAACFCDKEKSIITLTREISSEAHWTFMLLYEFYHALHGIEQIVKSKDELDDTNKEQLAIQFAGIVLLGEDPHDLVTQYPENSCCSIYTLSTLIEKITKENGARADILTNHISLCISFKNSPNYRADTNPFQRPLPAACSIVQNILQKKIDFNALTETDCGLLERATCTRDIPIIAYSGKD